MLEERETECAALRRQLDRPADDAPTILPHPTLRKRFEERVGTLRAGLADPENRSEAAKIIADLIEGIVIHPAGTETDAEAEVSARRKHPAGAALLCSGRG